MKRVTSTSRIPEVAKGIKRTFYNQDSGTWSNWGLPGLTPEETYNDMVEFLSKPVATIEKFLEAFPKQKLHAMIQCDECLELTHEAIELGEHPEYVGDPGAIVCKECLRKGLLLC